MGQRGLLDTHQQGANRRSRPHRRRRPRRRPRGAQSWTHRPNERQDGPGLVHRQWTRRGVLRRWAPSRLAPQRSKDGKARRLGELRPVVGTGTVQEAGGDRVRGRLAEPPGSRAFSLARNDSGCRACAALHHPLTRPEEAPPRAPEQPPEEGCLPLERGTFCPPYGRQARHLRSPNRNPQVRGSSASASTGVGCFAVLG